MLGHPQVVPIAESHKPVSNQNEAGSVLRHAPSDSMSDAAALRLNGAAG